MKKIFVIFLLAFLPIKCFGAGFLDVVINEIAWMGTTASANDEWIELYNNTDNPIDLNGWTLRAADGTPEINLSGTVPARSFFLLERTDDNTVPNITADLIYKGALNNSGEDLWLYDGQNNLIDEADFSSEWLAGDNSTKQTMERVGDNWQTSQNPDGRPKAKNSEQKTVNSKQIIESNSPPTEKQEDIGSPTAQNQKVEAGTSYPTGVVINEILPNPEGADEENEWIELYNTNNFEVNMAEWKIEDVEGKTTTYTIPKDTKIAGLGYLVFKRQDTKITLNNDTDILNLFWPIGEIVNSVSYSKAPLNQSYNKTSSGWTWSKSLTPGQKNIIASAENKNSKLLLNKEKSDNNSELDRTAAALGRISQEIRTNNPWFLFLTALTITIISAIVVLILKIRFGKVKKSNT